MKIFFTFLAGASLTIVQSGTAFGQWDKGRYTGTGLPYQKSLADIIANVAYWLLGIFGFIAIIGFIISGIMYLVSAGDEDRQERAKRAMYYSITGVVVGLVGLVVIYAVHYFLGGSSPSGNVINNAANSSATGAVVK